MLHPSYSDLIKIVNSEGDQDTPVVNSRYSIVMATAKRARQIVAGEARVSSRDAAKPLSTAVRELAEGKITILPENQQAQQEETSPQAQTDTELEAEAETEVEAETETEVEAETETEVEAESEAEADTEAEAKTEAEAETE